jgi:hypothetical protein
MTLFARAKALAYEARQAAPPAPPADTAKARLMALVGDDAFPYGMKANRASIDMLLKFSTEQKLLPQAYRVDELFDAGSIASS